MPDIPFHFRKLTLTLFQSNCYIIWDDEGVGAVIDPGGEPEEILKALRAAGVREVRYILNTHGHFDHIGANGPVKKATKAPIAIHEADAPLLVNPLQNVSLFLLQGVTSPPADRLLRDGDEVEIGRIRLQVLHTPGHTPGSVCFLGEGVLFTGDTLFYESVGRTDLPGGNERRLLKSLQDRILPLPDDLLVLPGHGPQGLLGEIKRVNPFLREAARWSKGFGSS